MPNPSSSKDTKDNSPNKTILVVEDEDLLRPVICDLLRKQGFTVLEARNGDMAIQLFQSHAGPVHLVISDMMMPGMSGPTLIKNLKLDTTTTRVLFLSGYLPKKVPDYGSKTAAFLEKPFSTQLFLQKIKEILSEPEPS